MQAKLIVLVAVSVLIAVLLATALHSFTRVSDAALADTAPNLAREGGLTSNAPRSASKNYLPIIFLNSATAGGAWLLAGNAGTNWATDFLGTTDNMTLTLRVSNTIAYRIVPAVHPAFGFAPNLIGGSPDNWVSPGLYGATIAGGGAPNVRNVITGTGNYATIAGGGANTASGTVATVGGGYSNTGSGGDATVGGGQGNAASGSAATIGGGVNNTASGPEATVAGGYYNTASGSFATVPGGFLNSAGGANSFAAGTQARALNPGAFVWSDPHGSFSSTRDDQFLVRASGGITLYTTSAAVDGNSITAGASLYSGSGSWNTMSNKNLKANFADVDSRAILERVSELPITTWNYKTQDASIRHIGPMAQDFAAAFKVGENDTTISTVDAQGVALAAIQGLAQENKAQAKELAELKERNARELTELKELKTKNENLEARLTALEQNAPSNALSLNALAPWGIMGLVAVWAMRRKTT